MLHKINYAKLYMLHIESGPDILFFLQIFQESKKKQDFFNPAFNSFSISISLGSKDSFW